MKAVYVPWLHMHQPLVWKSGKLISNLKKMIESKDSQESWNGKLMARAYKNPARYTVELNEMGCKTRIMLDFSGLLLESLNSLSEEGFFDKIEVHGEVIGNIIKEYKKALSKFPGSIEFAGTAYAHCYFPITPEDDWIWQIREWKNVFSSIFGKNALKRVKGFWLPEMGVPGYGDRIAKLIKILKDEGYEWMILPIFAVKGYEKMSYEKRVETFSKPHRLSVNGEEITVFFSAPYYFIDQQAGTTPEYIIKQCLFSKKVTGGNKPTIIVTASDGENGNVMMNEYFPRVFSNLFCSYIGKEVGSMTLTEYLKRFYHDDEMDKIELKTIGASWVGGHERWIWGEKRRKMYEKIKNISKKVHESGNKKAIKLLLIAETSCYVYWGTDWWFLQGSKVIDKIKSMI